MAELRRSSGNGSSAGGAVSLKVPNGSAAAAYSGPFDGRRVEYSEIFGCLSGSCSIPVLDLPPAIDVHQAPASGRSSGFDSEIFGGLDGGGFAVSYEKLVAERDKVEEALSSNGRVPEEDISQQAPDVSGTFQNGLCSHRVAPSDTNQSSSNSNQSDNGLTQFNMSFHKTRQGDIKNAVREEMHITQLHTIPGITSDAEMRAPLHNIRSDTSSRVPEDFNLNVDLNDRKSEVRQGMISPSFSSANSEGSEKELKIDQRQFDNESPASEDGPANFKQHSCSSSSRSTSSGDILYPDVTYLTASNITLRTKPLRVPPPSRPPPKLLNSQELPKMNFADSIADIDVEPFSKSMVSNKKYGGWDTSRRHAPRVSLRDGSSFLDVEVDASPAAASSAAAIKEAMEQAQSCKKPDQYEGGDQKERKADKAARDMKIFSQDVLEKRWVKEDIKKKKFVLEEQQKVKGASKLATDLEEKDIPHDAQFQNDNSTSQQRHSNIYNPDEGESALRCKARPERNQRTVNRAAKALEEKNLRDIITQREQAEKNRLVETLNAEVRSWSNGKEGNLRALLSTLQYILGPESGWQPIPPTDVITAAAIEITYRKATLCVHPDKLQQKGASFEQKYICEKVFDLLKEAWNQFNSEER